jgi:serine/threonine-protein kinase
VPDWGPDYDIAGRYRLVSLLGRGGMGEVWRAEHTALHSAVAIKLIHQRYANDEGVVRRFMQEARAAASLQSPYVVRTTDFGVVEGTPFLVMELLNGESLAERLERVGRLGPAEAARVVRHVARAIGKAHEAGFVHRDLKPDNIFICSDDEEEIVKVLDFGIAKAISGTLGDNSTHTRTGALLGTPYYMSPEQAQGDRSVDFRTDLWAIGVIAFECLVGKRPFDAEGLGSLVMQVCAGPIPIPSQLAPVPPGFDEWFHRALCRDPEGRFQTASELSHALRAVLVPSASTDAAGVSRMQWPGPAARQAGTESISAVFVAPSAEAAQTADATPGARIPEPTPTHGASAHATTPWSSAHQRLDTAAGANAAVTIPMKKSGLGWVALLAVAGVVGVVSLLLVVRVVSKRAAVAASADPAAASAPLLSEVAAAPSADPEPSAAASAPAAPEASAGPAPKIATRAVKPPVAAPAIVGKAPTMPKHEPVKPPAAPPASSKGRLGF